MATPVDGEIGLWERKNGGGREEQQGLISIMISLILQTQSVALTIGKALTGVLSFSLPASLCSLSPTLLEEQ